MARIRTIKPDFWKHEQIQRMSVLARLTLVGLISLADDEGRGRGDTEYLWGELHWRQGSGTKATWKRALSELRALEDDDGPLVVFYRVQGSMYYCLTGFKRQQRIDSPSPSKLPPPPEFVECSATPRGRVLAGGGSGRQETGGGGERGEKPPPSASPSEGDVAEATRLFEGANLIAFGEQKARFVAGWLRSAGIDRLREVMCDPRVQGQDAMVVNREFFARRRRPGESAPETTEQRAKRLSDAAAARDAERKRASDDRALQDWADGEISKLGGDDLACLQKLAAERLEGGLVTTNHEAFVRGQMRLIMIERRHASNA